MNRAGAPPKSQEAVMAGLGETVAVLARLRRQKTPVPPPRPRGLLSDVVDFGANPGELRMLVHAPAGLASHRPLVVVLHGCTQTAEQYADGAGWIALADRLGLGLLCPEQRPSNNPNRCFNWFERGDARRGHGEAASIRSMIEAAAARFGSDRTQIFVTGLSAGGAMASVMLATYPELFAGGGIVAGLPYGVANGMPQAFAAMFQDGQRSGAELGRLVQQASPHPGPWPRISVWHGSADATVKPSNADAIVQQWLHVHGLEAGSAVGDGEGHHVWSRHELALVERRLITGLGHGTPLATTGPDGVGRTGPFLLETGISSSLELIRFWGIAADDGASQASGPQTVPPADAARPTFHETPAKPEQGVAAIINRALRAAGLMK
jgi:poly(hydroxyalkanoate) depolymerase family esterase